MLLIQSKKILSLLDMEMYRKEFLRQAKEDKCILLPPGFEYIYLNDELFNELKELVLEYDEKSSDEHYTLLDKLKTIVIKYSN